MGVAALVELLVGVAHRLRAGAAEHDLEIDRLEAVVDVAVNDAGRAGDALPGPETRLEAAAGLVLDKDVEEAFEDEEHLLDLVRVRGVPLPRLDIHDAEREAARRDGAHVGVLAGAAGADEAVLRAPIAVDAGVLEGVPVGDAVAEAGDVALQDL